MFNIVNTLNDIANLLAPSAIPVQGQNKVDSLDKIFDEITGNLARLNFIDSAYGGPGNWTTVNDALQSIGSLISGLSPTLNFSGTYLPVASNLTNLTSVVPATAQFLRVGDVVNVSGILNIAPTAAGGWLFEMTLPVASDLQSNAQLGGSFVCDELDEIPGRLRGSDANNSAAFLGRAVTTFTACLCTYSYQYLVIP